MPELKPNVWLGNQQLAETVDSLQMPVKRLVKPCVLGSNQRGNAKP